MSQEKCFHGSNLPDPASSPPGAATLKFRKQYCTSSSKLTVPSFSIGNLNHSKSTSGDVNLSSYLKNWTVQSEVRHARAQNECIAYSKRRFHLNQMKQWTSVFPCRLPLTEGSYNVKSFQQRQKKHKCVSILGFYRNSYHWGAWLIFTRPPVTY